MEPPRGALIAQRALAIMALAAALGAAFVERGSTLSAAVRAARPWPFWLSVTEAGSDGLPSPHLGVYDPLRRVLVLVRVPETARLQGKAVGRREDMAQAKISSHLVEPIDWERTARLSLELPEGEEEEEPAVASARALKAQGRSPRALIGLLLDAVEGKPSAADALLLALELRHTPLESLEPALLPDDASAPAFLERVFSPRSPEDEQKASVVEVLNGTATQGLAAQAAKILRSRGVDVMFVGPAQRPRRRTVVYDRTGDFDRAERVRAALGCPAAITATRIDPLRGVDASVELGEDCSF